MINEISNTTPKQAIAPTYNLIGKFGENTKARTPDQSVEHKTNKNVIENGNLIVEQYDRHGKLIRKTPPGYLPPGEKD